MCSAEMTVSRKALFFDVDGTILSEITRAVPESAARALSEARKKGHLVFINSGRTFSQLGEIKNLVEADGYLCGCGTYGQAEGSVFYSYEIPHERGIQIKKDIVKYNLDGILEAAGGCYVRKEESRFPEVRRIIRALDYAIRDYGWDEDCYEFDKFCVLADEASDKEGFFKTLEPDFQVIDRGDDFFECVPKGHSKATIMAEVLKKYGIGLENAYVFGDSMNDLPMFQFAENAVLMGHHDKGLEPYASFVTKTVEEDGIEYALKALEII